MEAWASERLPLSMAGSVALALAKPARRTRLTARPLIRRCAATPLVSRKGGRLAALQKKLHIGNLN
jgi:hypothetical protein